MSGAPIFPRVLQDIILEYLPDRDEVPYFSTFKKGIVQIYNGSGRCGDCFHNRKKWTSDHAEIRSQNVVIIFYCGIKCAGTLIGGNPPELGAGVLGCGSCSID